MYSGYDFYGREFELNDLGDESDDAGYGGISCEVDSYLGKNQSGRP